MRKFFKTIALLAVGFYFGYHYAWRKEELSRFVRETFPSLQFDWRFIVAMIALVVVIRSGWKLLVKTSTKTSSVVGAIAAIVLWVSRDALAGVFNANTAPWIAVALLSIYLVHDKWTERAPRTDDPDGMPARTPRGGSAPAPAPVVDHGTTPVAPASGTPTTSA